MTMDMITDANEGEIDEDVRPITISSTFSPFLILVVQIDLSLKAVLALHTRKVLHYKRLLERAHASSAAQLHALQAEVCHLREQMRQNQLQQAQALGGVTISAPDALCVCSRKGGNYWSGWRDAGESRDRADLAEALKLRPGESGSEFREAEVRRAVRSLPLDDRMRLCVSFFFYFYALLLTGVQNEESPSS
jgi:pyrimidine and pyridine-specific 5'-nucleotidase